MFGKLDLHVIRCGLPPTLVYTIGDASGEPVRVLSAGGAFQSATFLGERCMEPVFEYYRAFGRALEDVSVPDPRVLVVGGGGFAVPKHVRALRPEARIDVVEIDPRVIDAARRWFYADAAKAHVTCADGRAFVRQAASRGEHYDFIALDAFSGREPVASLAAQDAAHDYVALLASGGVLAANVVTPDGDAAFLRDFQQALESAFSHVELLACEDPEWAADDNFLLVARAPKI